LRKRRANKVPRDRSQQLRMRILDKIQLYKHMNSIHDSF
jgi:hypothetical protein